MSQTLQHVSFLPKLERFIAFAATLVHLMMIHVCDKIEALDVSFENDC